MNANLDVNAGPHIAVEAPCPGWRAALADCNALCREAALAALAAAPLEGGNSGIEIGIRLTDDGELRDLNRRYRSIDAPTNVLSFPMFECTPGADLAAPPDGPPLALGDVVLAFETVRGEAASQGKTLADHLGHLVVHGVLHLLGYDHLDDIQAAAMEHLEAVILAGLGVDDPYEANSERQAASCQAASCQAAS
jgi:probable rRNA maturation factor